MVNSNLLEKLLTDEVKDVRGVKDVTGAMDVKGVKDARVDVQAASSIGHLAVVRASVHVLAQVHCD